MNFTISIFAGIKEWLLRQVVYQKLNNPLGYALMLLFAVGLAFVLSLLPLKFAVLLVAGLPEPSQESGFGTASQPERRLEVDTRSSFPVPSQSTNP